MNVNPRYKVLFDPIKIGPKTAKNRFYQVPHAMGSGNDMPNTRAAQRVLKQRVVGVSLTQVIVLFIPAQMIDHFHLQDYGLIKILLLMSLW